MYTLSKKRRDGFVAAISRVGITEKILKNDRVCSRHFHSGKPATLLDDTSPDWLPSLHLGHTKSRCSADPMKRWERRKAREAAQSLLLLNNSQASLSAETTSPLPNKSAETPAEESAETFSMLTEVTNESAETLSGTTTPPAAESASDDDNSPETSNLLVDASTQTDECEDLERLKFTVEDLMMRITPSPLSEETFTKDEYVKFYTGLPNLIVSKAVYNHVVAGIPTN